MAGEESRKIASRTSIENLPERKHVAYSLKLRALAYADLAIMMSGHVSFRLSNITVASISSFRAQ